MKKIWYGLRDRLVEIAAVFERDLIYWPKIFSGKPLLSYLGWIGYGNLGDELLFVAHQKLFASYELIPYHKKSLLGVFIKLTNRNFKACILGGGTLINLPGVWLEDTRNMLKLNLPMFALGTGVNFELSNERAFTIGNSVESWTELLNRFDYVGVRGPLSAEILNAYLKKPAEVIGDTALSLAPKTFLPPIKDNIIGICVGDSREIPAGVNIRSYIKVLTAFIKIYLDQGFEVILLPAYRKDKDFNERLLKEVNNAGCRLLISHDDNCQYLREVAKCSFFIGQKLHGTISATMMRVPSLMISYHSKCFDYMKSIGMEDCVIDIQELRVDILEEKFSRLREAQAEIRLLLNARILRYRSAQYQKAEELQQQFH